MSLEYKQVQPPEGINTSKEHPLKEFSLLLLGVLLFIVVTLVSLSFAAHLLAPFIPFSAEQKMADMFVSQMKDEQVAPEDAEITRYLQSLADRLAKAQDLPQEMSITVHYIDDDTVNAFATLGGHLFFFRGLLENINNENTLAMVMAHEIAHVKYRHPIKSLGRAVITGTAIAVVSSTAGGDIIGNVLGETGLLTALKFSREQEQQSDETALQSLARVYGHVEGANTLFDVFDAAHQERMQAPEFFSSHPRIENRIENIAAMARNHGWPITGTATPLPAQFNRWLVQPE
ncbi:MAG TPA: M48 family metallopeptidase [Candidatus Tenderia electrophaga]|uniref:M48 family metallopeptidase n=1 Tax=Candidatus Tenderia electrophaga TaxID=1748243 RepID=A0A832J7Y7_9GAMM|nr:M48 family metallopeptidase [Candidatus Tenderia electrophaga]